MNIFDKLHNSSVLVQLSGGKDSIATLHMLITHNIECQAIHFINFLPKKQSGYAAYLASVLKYGILQKNFPKLC